MIIAHTGDLHIKDGGIVTLDEQTAVLRQIRRDVDVIVVSGDIFDGASTPAERNAALETFQFWGEEAPVIAVKGNHDRDGDLLYLSELRTKNLIHVAEAFEILRTPECVFVLIPWPSRAKVAAWMTEADRTSVDAAAGGAMRALLSGARAMTTDSAAPVVVVGHLEIGSATMDSGQPIAGRCDIEVGADDLAEVDANYYALGHIHKPQDVAASMRYAGSPRQMSHGEAPGHGYTIAKVGRGGCQVKHVELKSPRFYTVEAVWHDGKLRIEYGAADPRADFLKLRYTVPEADRTQAREAAEKWAAAWEHCKLDPVIITEERASRSEVRAARSPEEKLTALWEAKGAAPGRSKEILEKLTVLSVVC